MSNFVELLGNGTNSRSLLSEDKGVGSWLQTPYGQIRLIGSDSGTNKLNQTWMALQADIKPDVILKNPSLKLVNGENVKEHEFFIYPQFPLRASNEIAYQNVLALPLFFKLQESGKPVRISVEFSVLYCLQEKCAENTQTLSLTIPAGYNYYTPFSSYIDALIGAIPYPATKEQIQVGALSDDSLWIEIRLPIQDPIFVLLNTDTSKIIPYTIIQKFVTKNQSLFVIKTQEEMLKKQITLFFNTENQNFIQKSLVEKSPLPKIPLANNKMHLPVYFWLIFLIISPCFCLLLSQRPRNEIVAKRECFKSILYILIGILCGIPIYLFFPYPVLSQSLVWLIFGSLLFVFLAFVSYPISRLGYGILTAIVPFFIFFESSEIPIPQDFWSLTHFFCYLAALNILPYVIFLFKPYWYVKIGQLLRYNTDYKLRFSFFLSAFLFVFLLLTTLLR